MASSNTHEGNITRIQSYLGLNETGLCTITRIVVSVAFGGSRDVPDHFDVEAQKFPVLLLLKTMDQIAVTFNAAGKPTAIVWKT